MISISVVFADKKEVIIENLGDTQPRSIVQKPTVFVDDVQNTLSLKFTSQGEVYAVTVTDETGFPVAQLHVISDNMQQVYSIPELTEGSYTVTIEGSRNSFSGSFDI